MKVARQGCWLRSCRSFLTGWWDPVRVACLPPSGEWGVSATAGACCSAAANVMMVQQGSYAHVCRSLRLLCTCLQVITAVAHVAGRYSSHTHVCKSLWPLRVLHCCRSSQLLHICLQAYMHMSAGRYGLLKTQPRCYSATSRRTPHPN